MIYIEKGDSVQLPKKFHYQHNICVVLYDLITALVKGGEFKDLHSTTIHFKNKADEKIFQQEMDGEQILNYLRDTGRKDELETFLTKHIFTHVLADFCNFIHESLRCARDGKMAVSYNLLRKPLTDELLIIEQLLTNRTGFIDLFFYQGESDLYDPSAGKHTPGELQKIISDATNELGRMAGFFGENVYDIRYNKASFTGLNAMMNQAHHIVTRDRNYRTDRQNLNFVFSVKEDFNRYWNNYYSIVPFMLVYCSCIFDRLAFKLGKIKKSLQTHRNLQRFLVMVFFFEVVSSEKTKLTTDFIRLLSENILVRCKCGQENRFERADMKLFADAGQFLCTQCFSDLAVKKSFLQQMEAFFKFSLNEENPANG